MWACASTPKGEQGGLDNCKILGCTEESICRDIFGQHPTGSAADVSMINKKPICSFGTYYDLESDTVIGDTNNLVGTFHQSFLINAKIEGTSVFTPLGAYYFWEGEWNKLPLLFRKTLYKKGKGNVNCVFHASIGKPGSISNPQLKLGGIWLGDKKKTVFDRYGEASEIRHFKDGVIGYVFVLDKEKRAYLAIEVFPYDEEFIWSIQISGEDKVPLKGLAGIEIGSTEQELLSVFGDPSERQPLRDIAGEFLVYTGKNYSFELNEKGKVRSIKIIVPESFLTYIPDIHNELTSVPLFVNSQSTCRMQNPDPNFVGLTNRPLL
jgi:hypothetical protein